MSPKSVQGVPASMGGANVRSDTKKADG